MALKHNLFTLKRQLEIKKGKEYSWLQIAEATQVHPNTLHNIAANKTRRVDLDIADKLLTFFAAEGMPVTVADLFVVESEPPHA